MAPKSTRGSIILEIVIVLMALLLVAVLIIPNRIWEEEDRVTKLSQTNMNALYEAERFYFKTHQEYTDSLSKLLNFVQSDSGLQQRQTLVSLTRSFTTVLDNILNIGSVDQISNLSQAAFEITGDLLGNLRYFRKYKEEKLDTTSLEINREMMMFDSSSVFPNFCRTKLFVDSLRRLREKVSDYPIQNSILRALNYSDSILAYYPFIEKAEVTSFWNGEEQKIKDLIAAINKTDIKKVSSVSDRLKKFIDRINASVNALNSADDVAEKNLLTSERQNLEALHKKFLSPEYFILTKRYGLTALNESDSILTHLSQENFYCPDSRLPYIVDTTYNGKLTVESPNLLDLFHERFLGDVEPIRDLPLFHSMANLDSVFENVRGVLDNNRTVVRRNTDVLLYLKELQVELGALSDIFFYKYTHDLDNFIKMLDSEKKLSVLKPAIEDLLNPIDTLATRLETGNIKDLESKLLYFDTKFKKLDSMSQALRISRRNKQKLQSTSEAFQPAFEILSQMKSGFSPSYAEALREASSRLEKDLLNALEGEHEIKYLIFRKKHVNHGYIRQGEKSWEKK